MALAWKAGWVNSPQGFESPILRHTLHMTGPSRSVNATSSERSEVRAGDELVAPAHVVMDRAFTVPGPPEAVFPWFVQLGKQRAGWYLPRSVERFVPTGRRALRHLDPRYQDLRVGD